MAASLLGEIFTATKGTDNIRAEIHSKGSAQAPGWLPSRPPGAEDRRRRGNRHGSVRKKRAF